MKKLYTLLFLSFIPFFKLASQGIPCTDGTQQSCKCSTAEILCSSDQLDKYAIKLFDYQHPTDGPSPICENGGAPNNPVWFAFIAWCSDLDLLVKPTNCFELNQQKGMQIGIYPDCNKKNPVACVGDCIDDQNILLSMKGLIIGKTYYCCVDGCAGAVCDISFDVLSTCIKPFIGDWPDSIKGEQIVCNHNSSPYNYSITLPSGATSLHWYIDGNSVYVGKNSLIPIDWKNYALGEHEICVDAISETCVPENESPIPQCFKVNVIEGTLNAVVESNYPNCTGDSLYLSASGGENYFWSGPSGFNSTLAVNNISNLTSDYNGLYTVTITNSLGCIVLDTVPVIIADHPMFSLSAINFECTDACYGAIKTTAGQAYSYLWSNNITEDSQYFLCPGTYYVTVSNKACEAYDSATVYGILSFKLSIVLTDTTMTAHIEGGLPPFDFLWSNGQKDSTIHKTTGYFCVEAVDKNNCYEKVCDYVVSAKNQILVNNKIKISPIPATGQISIEVLPDLKSKVELCKIIDIQGKLIKQFRYLPNQVSLSNFSKGLYVLVIKTIEGTFKKQFIVE